MFSGKATAYNMPIWLLGLISLVALAGFATMTIALNFWLRTFHPKNGPFTTAAVTAISWDGILLILFLSWIAIKRPSLRFLFAVTKPSASYPLRSLEKDTTEPNLKAGLCCFGLLALIGFFEAAAGICTSYAAMGTSEILQAMLGATVVPLTAFFSFLLLPRRRNFFNFWVLGAVAFTLGGIAVLVATSKSKSSTAREGNGWPAVFFLGAVCNAFHFVLQSKFMLKFTHEPPIEEENNKSSREEANDLHGSTRSAQQEVPSSSKLNRDKDELRNSFRQRGITLVPEDRRQSLTSPTTGGWIGGVPEEEGGPVSIGLGNITLQGQTSTQLNDDDPTVTVSLDDTNRHFYVPPAPYELGSPLPRQHEQQQQQTLRAPSFPTAVKNVKPGRDDSAAGTMSNDVGTVERAPLLKNNNSVTGSPSGDHRLFLSPVEEEAIRGTNPVKADDFTVKITMLFIDTFFQIIATFILLPLDALPGFGTSSTVRDSAQNFAHSVECIHTCSENGKYFVIFLVGWCSSHFAATYLNHYSATYASIIIMLKSPVTAAVLLICPAWNVASKEVPVWAAVVSLLMLVVATILLGTWEVRTRKSTACITSEGKLEYH